ncbi:hypothetical protein [uncultured Tenacibaculum sp.]|uniref:hypothetical protein n=1 Tax=uncultured Tenacibaculum sp. TaxID=174713 RepID=UPI002635E116|nr:hypothetical protein [uncultured Tenacibaculum sp.]
MIINRVKEFIEFKGITISDFENTINIGNGVLNEAINSRTEINSKWLVVISANYPELNFNWLITGNDSMLNLENDYVVDLTGVKNENILDYILINSDSFREETKIDAVVTILSNFQQQRELKRMYAKIESYEKLLEQKLKNE